MCSGRTVYAALTVRGKSRKPSLRGVALTPQGRTFDSRLAKDWPARRTDWWRATTRVRQRIGRRGLELSIGDFVLTGGGYRGMSVMDAWSRIIPRRYW
jgi:tRNA G37 N-methylase TrmD